MPPLPILPPDFRYELEGLLGEGGMAQVYRARDRQLGRPVALKFIRWQSPRFARRLYLEAELQASLDHDRIAKVYDVGELNGSPFIAMQLVEGPSLEVLADSLGLDEAIEVMRQVAEAVHAAHLQGLLHGDLKPSNILVGRDPQGALRPYVVDFGLARSLEATGLTLEGLCTPQYAPPEQVLASTPLDARSDVYALGATLYALVVGKPPRSLEPEPGKRLSDQWGTLWGSPFETAPVPPRRLVPSLPLDVETIILKALEADPVRRYPTSKAFAEDLGRWQEGRPLQARPPGLAYRLSRWVARNRTLAWVGAAALTALLASTAGGLWRLERTRQQAHWALRFNLEVRDLEAMERQSAMLPSHDRAPERALFRKRLEAMESEVGRQGGLAKGPGEAALGKGWLVLREYDKALAHLDRAVQAGYHPPDVSLERGTALLRLYMAQVKALVELPDRSLRMEKLKELEDTFRRPALTEIQSFKEAPPETQGWLSALLALAEDRHTDALTHIRSAIQRRPWVFEYRLLEGEILQQEGMSRSIKGAFREAVKSFDEARAAYARGKVEVRSESAFPLGEAQAIRFQIENQVNGDLPVAEELPSQLVKACHEVRVLDPRGIQPDLLQAAAWVFLGVQKTYFGGDSRGDLLRAAELGEAALRRDPSNLAVLQLLSMVWNRLGECELYLGLDPGEGLGKAQKYAEKALSRAPRDPYSLLRLASIHSARAMHEQFAGRPNLAIVAAGLGMVEKVIATSPNDARLQNAKGILLWEKGEALAMLGGNPLPVFQEAGESFKAGLKGSPDNDTFRLNLYLVGASTARWEWERFQRDPSPRLLEAESAARGVLRSIPNSPQALFILTSCLALDARWKASRGVNPLKDVREGKSRLREVLGRNPSHTIFRKIWEGLDEVESSWRPAKHPRR